MLRPLSFASLALAFACGTPETSPAGPAAGADTNSGTNSGTSSAARSTLRPAEGAPAAKPGKSAVKPAAESFTPMLGLRPLAVSLARGATQAFQAEINYPEGVRYLRQPVKWEVVEAGGGAISGSGLYTAPAAPGVYHVKVTREDFPEVTATATVTVK